MKGPWLSEKGLITNVVVNSSMLNRVGLLVLPCMNDSADLPSMYCRVTNIIIIVVLVIIILILIITVVAIVIVLIVHR